MESHIMDVENGILEIVITSSDGTKLLINDTIIIKENAIIPHRKFVLANFFRLCSEQTRIGNRHKVAEIINYLDRTVTHSIQVVHPCLIKNSA